MIIWKVEGDTFLRYFKTKEIAKRFMSEIDEGMLLQRVEIKNRDHLLQELNFAGDYQAA